MKRISIGNDIVDLQYINPGRSKQKKFYSKFITEAETRLYAETNPVFSFEQFIWFSWSVKESVFKFQKRFNPKLSFAPGKINIQQIYFPEKNVNQQFEDDRLEQKGFVQKGFISSTSSINSATVFSKSFISNEFIFTVTGNREYFRNIFWGIQKINDTAYHSQSENVRKFCLKKLMKVLKEDSTNILKAESGYPYLANHENIFLSFAHHNNFIAYSFFENISFS